MEHQTGTFTTSDGFSLFTRTWLPTAPAAHTGTILLIHGYGEHSGRYQHVGGFLAKRGYAVCALDLRGHGRSRGQRLGHFDRFQTLVDDVAAYATSLPDARRSPRQFVLGHSMGGLVALCYAIRYQPPINGLILSGAMLAVGEDVPGPVKALLRIAAQIAPTVGVQAVDAALVSRDSQVVEAYRSDPDVYHGKATLQVAAQFDITCAFARQNLAKITCPVLTFQGTQDKVILPHCATDIYNGVSSADKHIRLYDGLFHETMNEPEKQTVLDDLITWIEKR